jgi:lipopolysaccharide/colanic/teichoic acid biosynthesis glycosyltransferase
LFFPPFDQPAAVPAALKVSETVGVPASFPIRLEQPFEAKPEVRLLFGRPFVTFEVSPKPAVLLATKRAIDFTLAAAAVVLLAPLFLLAALAILAAMGRPVLFAQERAGLYGRRFRMLKFRTMEREAEAERDALLARNEMSGPVFKLTDDPRVTRLGRWLRKYSIDELPQLANVLFGSMSLVGPRPLPIREQKEIRGWHRRRLSMKPGITGLWQVSGRSEVDFEEWMKLDLRYVDEWSLRLDAWILLRTVPAVLLGRGSR